ncbi:WD40/YVTN/BNR-like repeat-containing protein [Gemmatimonas sp.]|uniref:WD40/YVTN/BNR-like repeat-containing protein n=1 Tax=Gemmatimonas sp. TaxID=1962908 RepID=UPI003983CBDC
MAVAVAVTVIVSPVSAQTAAPTPTLAPAVRISEQTSGTSNLLQAVHAVSERVVWASGHGGVVLRSINGGDNWEARPTASGDSLEFRDVHAIDADTAWILSAGNGAKSRIYRTTNGGASWTLQFMNPDTAAFYDCMSFGSGSGRTGGGRTGVAFSDASGGRTNILHTENDGVSWRLLAPSVVPGPLPSEGAFAASGLCVVHGDARTVFIATGSPGARLLRSRDGGRTWDVENTPFTRGTVAGLTGLAFKDGQTGLVVAADINRLRTDSSSAVVGITTDAGRTWELRTRPPLPGALVGVAWVPGAGGETAVVTSYGGAFITSDAARTWRTLTTALTTGVSAVGTSAWIVGGGGTITRLDW